MKKLKFKKLEWNDDLFGFVAVLSNEKVIHIQFEKDTNSLSRRFGEFFARISDDEVTDDATLTDDEIGKINQLIRKNEEIMEAEEKIDAGLLKPLWG